MDGERSSMDSIKNDRINEELAQAKALETEDKYISAAIRYSNVFVCG